MSIRLALAVAALMMGACRTPPAVSPPAVSPPGAVVRAPLEWIRTERIGRSAGPELTWRESGDQRVATIRVHGRNLEIALLGHDPTAPPDRWRLLLQSENDSDAIDGAAPIPWRTLVPGQLLMAKIDVASDPPIVVDLRSTDGVITATPSIDRAARITFFLDDIAHEAWFVDADMDGRLGGPHDLWVAGPAARLSELAFPNPDVEMRRLDEAWCLGQSATRFVRSAHGSVELAVDGPLDRATRSGLRSELRATHDARVLDAFIERTGVPRATMLRAQGEATPERPMTAAPAPWMYVDSWDEALQRGLAAELPLLVAFSSNSCGWCYLHSWLTHRDAEVDRELRSFALVKIDLTLVRDPAFDSLPKGPPATLLVGRDGHVIDAAVGFSAPSIYAAMLRDWRERASGSGVGADDEAPDNPIAR